MLPGRPGRASRAFSRVERGPRGLRFAPVAPPAGAAAAAGRPRCALRPGRRPRVRQRGRGGRAASWCWRWPPGVAFSHGDCPRMHGRPRPPSARPRPGRRRRRAPTPASCTAPTAGGRWCCRAWATSRPTSAPARSRIRGRRPPRRGVADGGVEECDVGRRRRGRAPRRRRRRALLRRRRRAASRPPAPASGRPGGGSGRRLAHRRARPRRARRRVLAACHEDGTVSVWEAGAPSRSPTWPSPVAGRRPARAVGRRRAGGPRHARRPEAPAACLAARRRRRAGAPCRGRARHRPVARPATGCWSAGDWGCAWLTPLEEDCMSTRPLPAARGPARRPRPVERGELRLRPGRPPGPPPPAAAHRAHAVAAARHRPGRSPASTPASPRRRPRPADASSPRRASPPFPGVRGRRRGAAGREPVRHPRLVGARPGAGRRGAPRRGPRRRPPRPAPPGGARRGRAARGRRARTGGVTAVYTREGRFDVIALVRESDRADRAVGARSPGGGLVAGRRATSPSAARGAWCWRRSRRRGDDARRDRVDRPHGDRPLQRPGAPRRVLCR